jgi:hypothetical protein
MIKNRTALRTRTAFLTKQKTKEIAVLPRRPLIFPRPFSGRAITKIPGCEPTVSVRPLEGEGPDADPDLLHDGKENEK